MTRVIKFFICNKYTLYGDKYRIIGISVVAVLLYSLTLFGLLSCPWFLMKDGSEAVPKVYTGSCCSIMMESHPIKFGGGVMLPALHLVFVIL